VFRKTLLVISLVLLVGTVWLWVASDRTNLFWDAAVTQDSWQGVDAADGHLLLQWTQFGGYFGLWEGSSPAERSLLRVVGSDIPHETMGFWYKSPLHWSFGEAFCLALDIDGPMIYVVGLPLWSAFLVSLAASCIGAYPIIRRLHRRRHNLCVRCGYDLRGNVSGVCTECGIPVEERTVADRRVVGSVVRREPAD